MMQPQDLPDAARVQALIMTTGLLTFVCVGLAACLALVVGVFYLVVNLVLVLLAGIVEAFAGMAGLWAGADPFCKILVLVLLAYGGYRLWRLRAGRRGGKHAI